GDEYCGVRVIDKERSREMLGLLALVEILEKEATELLARQAGVQEEAIDARQLVPEIAIAPEVPAASVHGVGPRWQRNAIDGTQILIVRVRRGDDLEFLFREPERLHR